MRSLMMIMTLAIAFCVGLLTQLQVAAAELVTLHGSVFYAGMPVEGAVVTVTTAAQQLTSTTQLQADGQMGYQIELMAAATGTLETQYEHAQITRTIQVMAGEFNLAFAWEWEVFSAENTHTEALMLANDWLWSTNDHDVHSLNLMTQETVTYTLPIVQAFLQDKDEQVWALGTEEIYQFDGTAWVTHTYPFSGSLLTFAAHPTATQIWVGGYDGSAGHAAIYDYVAGTWLDHELFTSSINAMAIADDGDVWFGTWGEGLYRQTPTGWQTFTLAVISDLITTITIVGDEVWVGTSSHNTTDLLGYRGGIGRFNRTTDTWTTYTPADGLPYDRYITDIPAAIQDIVVTAGQVWAGTDVGMATFDTEWEFFRTVDPLTSLIADHDHLFAISDKIYEFGTASHPLAEIITATIFTDTIQLDAIASDQDGSDQITVWEWVIDGELRCNTPACMVPITVAPDIVTLRVQDNEGQWTTTSSALPLVPTAVTYQQQAQTTFSLLIVFMGSMLALIVFTIYVLYTRTNK